MKTLKRLGGLMMAMAMFIAPASLVQAQESADAAQSAREGVVQVNTVFVDAENEKHIVCGGAGFIIGDSEGTEYVITCNHIVNPNETTKTEAATFYGLTGEDGSANYTLATEVVVEGDVVLSASLITGSSELDMAVLQLPQPIYTRTPLRILTSVDYNIKNLPYGAGDKAYALGFPSGVSYNSETQYYLNQDVELTPGKISELTTASGIQVIVSDVDSGANNYGGPLVDSNGYVIGMNLTKTEDGASVALDSTKIAKVLDGLGIVYSKANDVPKADVKETKTEDKDTEENAPTKPVVVEKKNGSMVMIVTVAAVLIVAALVMGAILMLLNKKNNTSDKPKKTYNGPVFETSSIPAGSEGVTGSFEDLNGETTVLGAAALNANDGETTLLSDLDNNQQISLGRLIRKRTSETIEITKTDFTIGKDANNSDYYVDNNGAVSRQHAVISSGRNGAYIKDCNSTNGSWINGTKLESERLVLLNDGDIIKLANEEFEYQV